MPLRKEIQEKLEHYGLDWHAEARGLVISLPQAVLFPQGKAEVNATALPMVGHIADVLKDIPNKINLAGHADPVPIHNRRFKNNWELAAARSLSASQPADHPLRNCGDALLYCELRLQRTQEFQRDAGRPSQQSPGRNPDPRRNTANDRSVTVAAR